MASEHHTDPTLISATLDSTAVDPVDDIDGTIGCNMKSLAKACLLYNENS